MILAFETCSSDGSIALASSAGELIADASWSGDQRQGSVLLTRVLELLAAQGRALADLRALAVGIGPGSFTGLRAGMSLAKGLAFGLSLPLVGLPSLPAWLAAEPAALAALARAGAREAYLLERGSAEPVIRTFDELDLLDREAVVSAPTELAAALGLGQARPPRGAAAALARAAASRLAAEPAGDDLDLLEPAYLRSPRGVTSVTPWP